MKIAIFGGTFDPIHYGHLQVARTARDRFSLDRVIFVPSYAPHHKNLKTYASFEDRLEMVRLACEDEPGFEVSDIESQLGKSYSYCTIIAIRESLKPEDELYFLIGADAFAEIRTWYRWQDVIRMIEFIVIARPGYSYEVPDGAVVHKVDDVHIPISATELRRRLSRGEPVPEIPPKVLAYIKSRGLYVNSPQ